MKYQDTLEQASEKATQVNAFLQRNQLAAHPVNYTVSYEYISGHHTDLCSAIEQKLTAKIPLDDFIMSELFQRWLIPDNQQHEQLLQDMSGMVSRLTGFTDVAAETATHYLDYLDNSLQQLVAPPPSDPLPVISGIQHATAEYQQNLQNLQYQLQLANQQSHQLRDELDTLKQSRMRDPLTGLYNRIAMRNQVDIWLNEQQDRHLSLITVELDNFNRFSAQYGRMISDTILARVAGKISSYIIESGIPVRSAENQFMLLLPDIDLYTATVIAEQIRKGIEKLRFISSRNKQSLPRVTISLGVSHYQADEGWYPFLTRSNDVLKLAINRGGNKVAIETML